MRKVAHDAPTLLLDESDSAFKAEAEYSEALRGILNAGYRQGGVASLCVKAGSDFELRDFPTFCPKAMAGIGKLPDTVADRSIRISLKRRAPSEKIERFRLRNASAQAKPLRERLERWAIIAVARLADSRPSLPEELSDRAADVWEPLLAIADAAGEAWVQRAREAALVLSGAAVENGFSLGVRLLHDIRSVLNGQTEAIPTSELLTILVGREESPWGDLKGRPLDARRLARILRPYDIKPGTVRVGSTTSKGYHVEDFKDAFCRYTPEIAVTTDTTVTPKLNPVTDAENVTDVSVTKTLSVTAQEANVTDVTVVTLPGGVRECPPDGATEAVLGMPVGRAIALCPEPLRQDRLVL